MKHQMLARGNVVDTCKKLCLHYGLSSGYSAMLHYGSRTLVKYMQEKDIEEYTPETGVVFREYVHTIRSKKYADAICRSIDLLNSFVNENQFVFQKSKIERSFPGKFGKFAMQYIDYLRNEKHSQAATIYQYEYTLNMFAVKMDILGVTMKNISLSDLLDFFSSIQNMKYNVVQIVKSFLNYLIEHGLISQNLYLESIRPINYKKEKIPSYYTKQEILKIESCVDRKNIVGKRDYAMILLASRLGLRSSDIRCLKFHEIDWDKNEIHLTQKKTKKVIVLPLLEDVGVALIDYIQNARPKTSLKDIFVSFRPPYRTISAATLSTMMAKYINKSGINCYGKHHGIHSMRHSLATNLLGDNVSLPTISSILGHSSTESAKDYMSIDLNSLIYCSHDVPVVDSDFYEQEGGDFYV